VFGSTVLFVKDGPGDDLVVRSARVIDPGEGIDGSLTPASTRA